MAADDVLLRLGILPAAAAAGRPQWAAMPGTVTHTRTMTTMMRMSVPRATKERTGMLVANGGTSLATYLGLHETRMALTRRSGISVQNPDRPGAVPGGNLVRDLLRRAAEYVRT